ncbi:MAG: hypothetical protein ACYCZH_15000 [Sulfuriferula sp.]
MIHNSTPKSAKQRGSATSASSPAAPKTSSPAAKTSAKATARSLAKPAVKPATKTLAKAPTKATEKPSSKPVTDQAAAKKGESAKADKNPKPKKPKLVRDSFTMPESEHDLIAAVKKRCVAKGLAVKKSEVLRAAIIGFAAQSDASVMVALQALMVIKTGRPLKGHK